VLLALVGARTLIGLRELGHKSSGIADVEPESDSMRPRGRPIQAGESYVG
jgi:hypothetical protein